MELRRLLAAWLSGASVGGSLGNFDERDLLEQAYEQGVTALLADRLMRDPWAPASLRGALLEAARGLAGGALAQQATLSAVLGRLQEVGLPVMVLKGTALRTWLYPAPYLRECSDIDLLFASREAAFAAAEALRPLGFEAPYRAGRFDHEVLCRHARKRIDLDLHWALARSPALQGLPGFAQLMAASVALPGLGPDARGCGPVHALLHACVHRASNLEAGLGDRLKWLYDVHLLAARLDGTGWNELLQASRDARVCGIVRAALMASNDAYATVLPEAVLPALAEAGDHDALDAGRMGEWRYRQWRNLLALPGWRLRLAWLWERAFPDAGYLRELYGGDLSRMALARARLGRLASRISRRAGRGTG